MKQKIKEALQQAYKNLGLNDEAFEGVATFGETLGINEETLANFVKGAEWQLKKMQSDADKVRNATIASNKQVEELKAKLAQAEADLKATETDPNKGNDLAKLLDEKITALVQPLQERLAAFEGAQSAENAYKSAKDDFFANDYAKKYTTERDDAWERATEINELTGKKMSAEELKAKAMGYFNTFVSRRGVDITKPFKSEGSGDDDDNFDVGKFREHLEETGRIPKKD